MSSKLEIRQKQRQDEIINAARQCFSRQRISRRQHVADRC
ncbi:Uncharacterised protein [Citrobacter koseri]|uniref:Uncharacterized protein n=1 Tax=Citrobacter koseri TaxID=545 RepID=A0A2X2V853_CITKO|nr:Uncharacterised protein [Citrobacter koseri]